MADAALRNGPVTPEISDDEALTRVLEARVAALRDELLADQQEAEIRGRTSPEIYARLAEAGVNKILAPKRFGGYELSIESFFRVMIEISRGDPGVGWMAGLGAGHVYHVASYMSLEAQEELLGSGEDFVAPLRLAQPLEAEQVAGGWRLNGRWDFLSGLPYSTHLMGGALLKGSDTAGKPDFRVVVIPRASVEELDNWGNGNPIGMQASGSASALIHDVVVPEHMTFRYEMQKQLPEDGSPGYQIHGNPMYLGRELGFFAGELAATQVGNAYAALDEYERHMVSKRPSFPPLIFGKQPARLDLHEYHEWWGGIRRHADAAKAILLGAAREQAELGENWARTGSPFSLEDDMRLRSLVMMAGKTATEAVRIAFHNSGAFAAGKGQRLQKYYRDAGTYETHLGAQYESTDASISLLHFTDEIYW